ncbi:hypothetical protein APTSU1_000125200 [Apodemus speciosus]|uniref:N-terminal Ras-GEF domain-containing protein n=1 Tax=Apodemus speciosus TaxID=105296 RepID=A0ABQ0EG46_APOSI
MFSCCLRTTGGSDLKKDKSEGHGGAWRYLVLSCLQCFWPFGQKETDLTEDSQAEDLADKGVPGCAPTDMKKPCRESPMSGDMVEKLVNHLVPSLQGRDPFFVSVFLYSYRSFTTTRHVLNLLLMRYAYFRPDCKEDEQVKNTTPLSRQCLQDEYPWAWFLQVRTLCSLLNSWIDIYPEEFCQTADLSILKKLEAYLIVNMPESLLNRRVHTLLRELQSSESEREDEEVSDLESHIAADSESEVWLRAVKQQPGPAGARDRIHQNTLMLKPDVTSAVQTAYLVAAVEPVSHPVTRHSGLSNISPSGQWVNLLRE